MYLECYCCFSYSIVRYWRFSQRYCWKFNYYSTLCYVIVCQLVIHDAPTFVVLSSLKAKKPKKKPFCTTDWHWMWRHYGPLQRLALFTAGHRRLEHKTTLIIIIIVIIIIVVVDIARDLIFMCS